VPACLSLCRRSGYEHLQSADHNSSDDSIEKLKAVRRCASTGSLQNLGLLKPDLPPSRSCVKSSTHERTEIEPRMRKNQIIAA
jgi:hypothetical protein